MSEKKNQITDPQGLLQASSTLSAISNPQRLLILCHLTNHSELSVSELQSRLELSQSALSQHLAKLRQCDLVETRKEHQTVYYSIHRNDIQQILMLLHGLYCEKQ